MKKKVVVAKKKVEKAREKKPDKKSELLYYGQHICMALAARRRQAVIRVYCTEERLPELKELLQWCAAQRKAYHVVSSRDLEKITGSVHHEGLAILAEAPRYKSLQELDESLKGKDLPLLYLDGVQNPHNIGTIMRVMASFGWPYLIAAESLQPMGAAAARMSEGGAEYVQVFTAKNGVAFCEWAKQRGYTLFGTSSHESKSLYACSLPKKSVFILGHEVHGMTDELLKNVDQRVVIPCTGQVESLNVAVASGLLLGEYTRLHNLVKS